MNGNNINYHRDPLLFFPYVSLSKDLRKGLPPREALMGIFKVLEEKCLYVNGRWTHQETYITSPEDTVVQFFQTIMGEACSWAEVGPHYATTSWQDHSFHLTGNLHKHNVILVPVGCKSGVTFKDVLTYCELNASFSGDSQKQALSEIAGYASACQLNRRFYVASSLCDRNFTLAAFVRGSVVISESLDIDSNPITFLSAVLGLSSASPAWCGFDPSMHSNGSDTYTMLRPFGKFARMTTERVLLHAATDMHSKGTKVLLCNVWEKLGAPPKIYPIKISWMVNPSKTPTSNDIDIAKLMATRAPEYPTLEGLRRRIFGKEDEYKIFSDCLVPPTDGDVPTWDYVHHWPGITIVLPEECDKPLAPCPKPCRELWETGYYPDDYEPPSEPDSTRNILERFNVPVRINGKRVDENWVPQDEHAIFHPPPLYGETRELIWVLYRSCGTSFVWFSCRRELVNGFLGGLAGHFNALMLHILHCDVSDPNLMFQVKDCAPESIVPDWPQGEGAYPKRPGMLGDWGYGADLKGVIRRVTGTFPYMATDLLSEKGKQLIVRHDLESFFWVLWVMCINMNGPFYTRRRWKDEQSGPEENGVAIASYSVPTGSSIPSGATSYISTATTEVRDPSADVASSWTAPLSIPNPELVQPRPSAPPLETFQKCPQCEEETTSVTSTRLPFNEEEPEKHAPPIWTTPGRHNLSLADVSRSKSTIPEALFLGCISPYFRQSGPGFLDGMKKLHTYFVKMQGPDGKKLKQELGEITHEKFCEILKDMRDSIPADIDQTSESDIEKARERYKVLRQKGHGTAISVLHSPPHRPRCSKRPAEEQNDDQLPKKKTSRAS